MQKTLENLAKAFIGESQARNRYTMYARVAKEEGYEEIAANFSLTADQEAEHAKWLMTMIGELKAGSHDYDEIKVEAVAPTVLSDTKTNLSAAIQGENYEYEKMYPEFADVADSEGLSQVAYRLRAIAKAEENHEDRFKTFLSYLQSDSVFKSEEEEVWVCRQCGYMHKGKSPVGKCPSCGHPQSFFERKK
jgi:rubrerythrin